MPYVISECVDCVLIFSIYLCKEIPAVDRK